MEKKYSCTVEMKLTSLFSTPDALVRARADKAIDFMKWYVVGWDANYSEEWDTTAWVICDDKNYNITVSLTTGDHCNHWTLRRLNRKTNRETILSVTDFYDGDCILKVATWGYVEE